MAEDSVDTRLGRMEGKLDMLIDLENKREERLHSVEKKVWAGSALAAVAGALIPKFLFPH